MRRLIVVVIALAALLAARRAVAVEGLCGAQASAWARRCSTSSGLSVRALRCPPGRLVAALYQGDRHLLDAEVGPVHGASFHRVGNYAVAPVGEFPDWNQVEPERRLALAALERCLSADPTLGVRWVGAPRAHAEHRDAPLPLTARVPWALLAALALVAASAGARWRRGARPRLRAVALLAALAAGTFVLRRWLWPVGFFHQNGHGPEWVIAALVERPEFAAYGPGYSQLFAAVAGRASAPDVAIFTTQAAAAALVPALAWIIAWRAGAGSAIATALGLCLAVDPALGRAAQSESYFSVGVTLGFLAAAILADGAARARPRSLHFALAVIAAGLVVAQIALVHPLLWIGAATLPLVALAGRGRLRSRLMCTLLAGLGIGAVVALAAGPSMASVLGGPLGSWNGGMSSRFLADVRRVAPTLLLLAVVLAFAPRGARRRLVPIAALLALLAFADATTTDIGTNTAVSALWFRQFLPALVALLAGSVAGLMPLLKRLTSRGGRVLSPLVAALVLLGGTVSSAAHWSALQTLPTDLREQAFALAWRSRLPPHAVVAYLSRAGLHIVTLPVYGRPPRFIQNQALWADEALPEPRDAPGPLYYYRSSLCSTSDGAAFCAKAERRFRLQSVAARELPAIPSMAGQAYTRSTVHVELYRVLGD